MFLFCKSSNPWNTFRYFMLSREESLQKKPLQFSLATKFLHFADINFCSLWKWQRWIFWPKILTFSTADKFQKSYFFQVFAAFRLHEGNAKLCNIVLGKLERFSCLYCKLWQKEDIFHCLMLIFMVSTAAFPEFAW